MVLLWYVYSMVLTNMYMSVLIKQMTHTSYVGSVESLEDVINQNLVPMMFEKSSSIKVWNQSSDSTLRLVLIERRGKPYFIHRLIISGQ